MSVAALMLVKDEADVLGFTLDHLLAQVDAVFVYDNLSTDGTTDILERVHADNPDRFWWTRDDEVGYRQAKKTTALARLAYERGHSWAVPCDADEFWRCHDPLVRVGDALDQIGDEYAFARALLYDHKATALDVSDEPNPYLRMGWRFRLPGKFPKVAVRLSSGVRIGMGNHEAETVWPGRVSSSGSPPCRDDLLVVEHYSWRSAEQLVRKTRNGARAYAAAPELAADYGEHWRRFGSPDSPEFAEAVTGWFWEWAYAADPHADREIGFFPAPTVGVDPWRALGFS